MQCVNNLHQIGLGYAQLLETNSGSAATLDVAAWNVALFPYVERNQARIYKCPDDKEAVGLLDAHMFYFNAAGYPNPIRPMDGSGAQSTVYSNLDGQFLCEEEDRETGKTFRQAIRDGGYAYDPAPGAYVFSVCADWDNNEWDPDFYFVVDPNCVDGGRAACFRIHFHGPQASIMLNGNVVMGFTQSGSPKALSPPAEGDWWEMGGQGCSYGMNAGANRFLKASSKVLAVEYCQLVANLASLTAPDMFPTAVMMNSPQWTGWGGGRARHAGCVNVLFGDLHVATMDPTAINPLVSDLNDQYWTAQ